MSTDLATEMREWPEFVAGDGYSVDLKDDATSEAVSVRFEVEEDSYIKVSALSSGQLYDRVVGRVVHALSAHSDYLMVGRHASSM
jgi:hypothetical protein